MQHAGGATIDEGMDVSVDGSDATYVTGYFTTAATFGPTTLNSSGVDDIFLAKLGTNGLYSWAVKAGGSNSDRALSVKTDAAGNSYITGFFYTTATFGSLNVTSSGLQDAFIAKYNTSGVCQWVKSCGGTGSDIGNGITVDNAGNVIVTGEFAGTATFGSTTLTSQNGSTDVFTTKLDANGNFLWAKKGSAPQTDRGIDVDCDPSGNIYVTGQFSDTITFDVVHNNNMLNAIFLVKYDPSGNEVWFRRIGGGSVNISNSIACNANGEIFLTGDFQGTLTFYGPPNTTLSGTYSNRIFIAKYDGSGALTWAVSESSDSPLTSKSISANTTDCFIAGNFKCTFDSYSDRYGAGIFNSTGYWDSFEGKYSAGSGAWSMSRQLGGKKDQSCNGIAVDGSGNPHLAGSYIQALFVPVDLAFYGYPSFTQYGMTLNNDAANGAYCNDPDYGKFAMMNSSGNSDIFVGNPIDPARLPYDFYWRSGSGCATPVVDLCIHKYDGLDYDCNGDTAQGCNFVFLFAATQTSLYSPTNSIGPDFTYLWSNGSTSDFLSATTSGYYSVTITSADGCYTEQDTIYAHINPPPPVPTISDDVVVNNNATVTQAIVLCADSVTLTGGGFGNNSHVWLGPIFGPAGTSQNPVVVDSSGVYSFLVTDANGCTNVNNVSVTLDHPLEPLVPGLVCLSDSDRNDSLRFCDGTPTYFFPFDSLSNPNANMQCIDNVYTILWTITPSGNATILPYTDCVNFAYQITTALVHQTGWYTVQEMIIRQSTCGNDTTIFSHSYYFEVLPAPPSAPIILTITGDTLICPGDSAMLVVTGGNYYAWSTQESNDTIYVSQPGLYSVQTSDTLTNGFGCTTINTGFESVTVLLRPQPVVTMLPSDGVICPGDSVQLLSTGSGTFVWQGPNGPVGGNTNTIYADAPGVYYCIVTDPSGCQLVSNSVTLQQYNTPSIVASPAQVICPGDSVTLTLLASGNTTVQWLPPLSGSSLTQIITQPGTYSCTVQACNIPTTVSVTILPTTVTAVITPLSATTVCEGDSILLGANAGLDSYNWQPGNSSAQQLYVYTDGMYYLTTADSGGCAAHDSIQVNFTPNTLQAPFVSDTNVCIGLPVLLTASGTPTLNWYSSMALTTLLGSGASFQTQPIYQDTAFYIQTNDGVCRSTVTQINVSAVECVPLTPNVFTPNGDGTNDTWSLYRPYALGVHVWIYDRWGVLVYEYDQVDGYWDGTYMANGKPVTDGVYYYVAHVTETNDVIKGEKGFIQLIRNGPK